MAKKVYLANRSEPALYTLFGISCHLKDFRLSFLLNKALEIELVKMDDFGEFSFYFFRDEDRFSAYYLIGNRGLESVLLPELKQTDFLLLLEGPVKKIQKDRLIEQTRGIPNVLTAYEVRFETIKNYATMLTDLEIHMLNILKDSRVKFSPTKK